MIDERLRRLLIGAALVVAAITVIDIAAKLIVPVLVGVGTYMALKFVRDGRGA